MYLHSKVKAYFGLPDSATILDLLEVLDQGDNSLLNGLLSASESRDKLKVWLEQYPNYKQSFFVQSIPQTLAHTLVSSPSNNQIFVALIGSSPAFDLPTDLENQVFLGLINSESPWFEELFSDVEKKPLDWQRVVAGAAIVSYPDTFQSNEFGSIDRLLASLFGLIHPELSFVQTTDSVLLSNPKLLFSTDREFSLTKTRLLSEAMRELNPKWRFLSFYRIVEHAYLTNIKDTLLRDFDNYAKEAVKKALENLSSELNQLVALTESESLNLRPEFSSFDEVFDTFVSSNQFIRQVDKSAREESLYGAKEKYKKGIARFYKLRCSIAHAGTSSVIFEQFGDSNAGVIGLMQKVETIALKCMYIKLVQSTDSTAT